MRRTILLAMMAAAFLAGGSRAESPFRYQGTRVLSMGGAFVAVADDENATLWNPAGLARLRGPRLAVSGRMQRYLLESTFPLFDGLNFTYVNREIAAGFAYRGFGASILYSGRGYDDDIDIYCGGMPPLVDMETVEYILDAWVVNAAYGREIARGLSLGAAARYIRFTIPSEEICQEHYKGENGFSCDAGALYEVTERFRAGFTIDNAIATRMDHILQNPFGPMEAVEDLPVEANLGIAWRPLDALLLAVDVRNIFEDGVRSMGCGEELSRKRSYHIGGEWRAARDLRVRGGYFRDARTFDDPCRVRYGYPVDYAWYDNITAGLGWSDGRLAIDLGAWWDTRKSRLEELPWRVKNTTVSGSASISFVF